MVTLHLPYNIRIPVGISILAALPKDLRVLYPVGPNLNRVAGNNCCKSITSEEEEGTSLPVAVEEVPAHRGAGEDWDCWILAEGAGLDCQSPVAGEGWD